MPLIVKADPNISGKQLQVVPLTQIGIPEELKKEVLARQNEAKTRGFNETDNRYAQFLLNIKNEAPSEIRAYRKTQDLYDTHLKQTVNEIKLAFTFKKLPIENEKIIGYAPIGTYIKDPEGWNGIKVFFEIPTLGICAYEFNDLKLSNGSIQLTKENTQYFVNNKPSTKVIEGSASSGFTYNVTWYDGLKVNTLDCATKIFSKDLINNVILLANQIDKR